jgi:hypothetical protein
MNPLERRSRAAQVTLEVSRVWKTKDKWSHTHIDRVLPTGLGIHSLMPCHVCTETERLSGDRVSQDSGFSWCEFIISK